MNSLVGAGMTHEGLHRPLNEDSYFFDNELGLYLVADGMGGARSGEVASRIAVETVSDTIRRFENQDPVLVRSLPEPDPQISDRANILLYGFYLANRAIYESAGQDLRHQGMGTTLVAILCDGDQALVAHVGDSRAFLVRNGRLKRLTVDHSVVEDPKLKDVLDLTATAKIRLGHTLTRAMGVKPKVSPSLAVLPLVAGDAFLLCTDGLTNMVQEADIVSIMSGEDSLYKKAQLLIDLALAGGGKDNITVVLAEAVKKSLIRNLIKRLSRDS